MAAVALVAAAPAAAINRIDLSAYRTQIQPLITTLDLTQIITSRTHGSYAGVGTLFVTYASTATTGFGAICTGALTSNQTVLTAGHCLSSITEAGKTDRVTSVRFFLPSLGERTPALTFTGTDIKVNPGFDPTFAAAGSDLAQFKLTTKAAFAGYQLYTGNSEVGSVFTRVGTGTTGGLTSTSGGPYDFTQRAGVNVYQYTAADLFGLSSGTLLSEFTDGTLAHDPFYQAGGDAQPTAGLTDAFGKLIEVNSSPGDSGGPEFIDGKLAGVTSFGVTGAIIDGACGPGHIDPYASPTGACTNSSIGEISGDTRVSAFLPFINDYIASVPEPATWALYLAGFGVIGAAQRRRRAVVA
jgi:hypothetical protein